MTGGLQPGPVLTLRVERDLHIDPAGHPERQAWLSAASGLLRVDGCWYVVADDEHHLGVFEAGSVSPGRLIRLVAGGLPEEPRQRKARKPDFEALLCLPGSAAAPAGSLLALGSGSKPNREQGAWLGLEAGAPVRLVDLTALYAPLHGRFGQLNIEGAFIDRDRFCLLQRGNSADPASACVTYDWAQVSAWLSGGGPVPNLRSVQLMNLGTVEGVPLSLTDGCALPEGGWVFSAVAEDTSDAYVDGRCVASAVGWVDATGTLRDVASLSHPWKVEGIVAERHGDHLGLTLVTDADDPAVPASLLTGRWTPRAR